VNVIRVVVVDDEALVRSGFRLILQAAGDMLTTFDSDLLAQQAGLLERPSRQ
jgi:hypothetical protein